MTARTCRARMTSLDVYGGLATPPCRDSGRCRGRPRLARHSREFEGAIAPNVSQHLDAIMGRRGRRPSSPLAERPQVYRPSVMLLLRHAHPAWRTSPGGPRTGVSGSYIMHDQRTAYGHGAAVALTSAAKFTDLLRYSATVSSVRDAIPRTL